jgi:hypothetical protein
MVKLSPLSVHINRPRKSRPHQRPRCTGRLFNEVRFDFAGLALA